MNRRRKVCGLLPLIEHAMDLYRAIQELYAEKERLERVIASLEELQRSAGVVPVLTEGVKRRGRKFMAPKERQEVSERMKKYWATRRKQEAHQKRPAGHGA